MAKHLRFLTFFHSVLSLGEAKSVEVQRSSARLTREDEDRWKRRLLRASEGNAEEYEQLLREMRDYLSVFCRRHLYSPQQVDDCVQECLLAIHKAKHTFRPDKPLGPWFFTIVRHKIIDQYRSRSKHRESETLDIDEHHLSDPSSPELDLASEIENLLPKLNPSFRDAFRLTKIEGMSIAQAAKSLKIGESAVKVQVHRASKAIRKLIAAEFDKRY